MMIMIVNGDSYYTTRSDPQQPPKIGVKVGEERMRVKGLKKKSTGCKTESKLSRFHQGGVLSLFFFPLLLLTYYYYTHCHLCSSIMSKASSFVREYKLVMVGGGGKSSHLALFPFHGFPFSSSSSSSIHMLGYFFLIEHLNFSRCWQVGPDDPVYPVAFC